MQTLKYKIIKNKKQYAEYCRQLELLISLDNKTKSVNEELELLTFLIEKWDNEHNSFNELDPVQLLKTLMNEHTLKPVSLTDILRVSKGLISDILNYRKGLSKL